jgi:hypothetical protein
MSSAARAGGLGVAIATPAAVSCTTLEPKFCERCGRSFFREAGTPAIYCASCERLFVDVAQQKLLEGRASFGARKGEMNATEKQKTPTAPPLAVTLPEKRVCEVAGCTGVLSYNNKTGLCRKHRGRHRAHSKANGHAASAAGTVTKPNGHGNGVAAAKPNGQSNGREMALEARVNLVLNALPLDEKVRMISSWLRLGEC